MKHYFKYSNTWWPSKTIRYVYHWKNVIHLGKHDCTRTQWLSEDIQVRLISNTSVLSDTHKMLLFIKTTTWAVIVCFRPKRLTLKGYKQYWFKFQDTSISYFKSKEESIGEPIQQINLKGTKCIILFFTILFSPSSKSPHTPQHTQTHSLHLTGKCESAFLRAGFNRSLWERSSLVILTQ